MVPDVEVRSYYDQPVLKKPVWKWMIPAYFFSGGLAGASSLVALGGALTGRPGLARRARLTALASLTAGTGFLVADLGRPARFLNMLRVAKPSSPMSVGSWILAGYGPAAAAAAASDVLGILPGVGAAADATAGALGVGLATYTGVLVADTAVPVWHEARRELPFLFAAGAAAAAGGVAAGLAGSPSEAAPAVRLAVVGAVAELAVASLMERSLEASGVVEPLKSGAAGRMSRGAKLLAAAGGALMFGVGRRHRAGRVAGGVMIAAGNALTRFAIMEAGHESARDPRYVVGPQRRRVNERQATGAGG
jgi:formate-dependent nitrite reductase membrane component NrfD